MDLGALHGEILNLVAVVVVLGHALNGHRPQVVLLVARLGDRQLHRYGICGLPQHRQAGRGQHPLGGRDLHCLAVRLGLARLHHLPAVVLLHQLDLLVALFIVDYAVNVQVQVGAVAVAIGEMVPPLLVPGDVLHVPPAVGDRDGLGVPVPQGSVAGFHLPIGAHHVLGLIGGGVLPPDLLNLLGELIVFDNFPGRAVGAFCDPHFPHLVGDHGPVLVVLGQAVETELRRRLVILRPQNDLEGGRACHSVFPGDGDCLRAHGHGVVPAVVGDLPTFLPIGKVQLEGQGILGSAFAGCLHSFHQLGDALVLPLPLAAAEPSLVHLYVNGPQPAVGNRVQGVHIGGNGGVGLYLGLVSHLVAVVLCGDGEDLPVLAQASFPLVHSGEVALFPAVAVVYGASAHCELHHVKIGKLHVLRQIKTDKLRPAARRTVHGLGDGLPVFFQRLQGAVCAVVHPHLHRVPVEGVAVVDPVLLHHDDRGVPWSVGDDAGVIPAFRVVVVDVAGHVALSVFVLRFQQEVTVQVPRLVELGKILHNAVPICIAELVSLVKPINIPALAGEAHALRRAFRQEGL